MIILVSHFKMKKFKSTINEKSASFKLNKDGMLNLIEKLESNLELSKVQGNESALKRLRKEVSLLLVKELLK